MAITKLARFAASKKPYAFDWSSYRIESTQLRPSSTELYHRARVNAVWAGAALAFSRWTGDELFPSAAVKKLLEGRKGDCRGGFEQFFRDQEGASTSCNVDSSLWVEELLAEGETP